MKTLFVTIALLISALACYSQGCSDAGFCSLGALKNLDHSNASKKSIDIGSSIGIGEQKTFTFNPYVQYNQQLGRRLLLQVKLTATYADGFLGSAFNAGDIYGLLTYNLPKQKRSSLRFVAGIKIPLTVSNSKNDDNKPLPLDYQSSIGTYDFIAGLNYTSRDKLELAAGVQAPVIQINKNSFFPDEYVDVLALEFAPTNNFRRRSDVLLRAGYYIKLSHSLTIKPNLLGIYHLGKDSYENRLGKRTIINGSEGLTINGGIIATKQFKNSNRLELIAATPFTARAVRADGLTRKAAFNIQYSILL